MSRKTKSKTGEIFKNILSVYMYKAILDLKKNVYASNHHPDTFVQWKSSPYKTLTKTLT